MLNLICLSGGMDSATLISYAIENYGKESLAAIGFNYGSKHNERELVMAEKLANHYEIPFRVVNLLFVKELFTSSLLKGGEEIPEGHYADSSMATTVVPGRNLIMLSIAAGIVDSQGNGMVFMGMHEGDRAIYPDCREEFVAAAERTLTYGYTNIVVFEAPFINTDKVGILGYGIERHTPYGLTRTCYKDQDLACGKCGACIERLEAFANIGKTDPLPYAPL